MVMVKPRRQLGTVAALEGSFGSGDLFDPEVILLNSDGESRHYWVWPRPGCPYPTWVVVPTLDGSC